MDRQIHYSEIEKTLATGDLILFHGKQSTSELIELLEWSYWSHIGMIVLPKDVGLEGEGPFIWESTSSGDGIIDVILGKEKPNGPMLIPLKDRISEDIKQGFDNHFKIRYLNSVISKDELTELKKFIFEVHTASFPTIKDLCKIYLEGKEKNIQGPTGMYFCSQLVAQTYMKMGYLSERYVANGYSPVEFNNNGSLPSTKRFHLFDGAIINHV
ncbi:MAG: hypothetical protein CVU84_16030 [Firmicutes bacterium HGW-Firmicutes-1]|jgi:hypothetical protein|nr:MAG: hypothetical protein CVU84_16030 [Firmicutes bacterium HGW-Firmicutes-1]